MKNNFFGDIYTFLSISNLTQNKKGKDNKAIFYYSAFFTKEITSITMEEMQDFVNNYYFKNLMIFQISDDNEKGCELVNEFTGRGESKLTAYKATPMVFFSMDFIIKLLKHIKKYPDTNIVLIYKGFSLKMIKTAFKIIGIQISGGNNTLKHIFSPQQFLLSKIISLFYGNNIDLVTKSFLEISKNKAISRIVHDFTSEKDLLMLQKLKEKFDSLNMSEKERFLDAPVESKSIRFNYTQKRSFHSSSIIRRPVQDYKNTDYFPYLSKLTEILDDSNKTDVEKQTTLENFLNEFIQNQIDDYQLFIQKYKGSLHNLKNGNVKESIYECLNTYLLHKRKGDLNKLLPTTDVKALELIILSYSIIITYFNKLGYTSIAAIIGRLILERFYLKERKQIIDNSTKQKTPLKLDEYLKFKNIDSSIVLRIGDYFISLMSQYPHNIFERNFELSTKINKEVTKIQINPEFLDSVVKNIVINPANLPMLSEPLKWSHKNYGGYLKNSELKKGLITKSSENRHVTKLNKTIYETVNIINSTKFVVNNLLLNYLLNEGKFILDIVKPKDVLQRTITLKLAESLSNSCFYLTVNSDWRGRLVTESFFLTYQGNDLSMALVNFYEGEALTEQGLYYFKIYGANTHNMDGISKKSYFDRVKWVNDNYDKIISLDRDLILSAENPFSFASFCLNMKNIDKDSTWIVKSPIFLDATCSGIQHLAALLRDFELGSNVNLVKSSHSDLPNDLYNTLLEPINKAINKYGNENLKYSNLSLIKFDRKTIKQSIMTKVYNVTTYGITQQLKTKFEKVSDENVKEIVKDLKSKLKSISRDYYLAPGKESTVTLSNHDIIKIAKIINDEIFVVYPSLNGIYSYFLDIVKLVIKLGIPLSWVTPNGMEIVQHYLKTKKSNFEINILGRKTFVLKNVTDEMDTLKQIQGIIPNIIHSLDASHLMKVIVSSKKADLGYYPIITIHDCFGTHPNKMEILSYRVKSEFVLLYSGENFLNKFHKHVIASIKANNFKVKKNDGNYCVYFKKCDEYIEIPNMPRLGELDLNLIKESSYMIT